MRTGGDGEHGETVLALAFAGVGALALAIAGLVDWMNGHHVVHAGWYLLAGAPIALAIVFVIRLFGVRELGWSMTDDDGLRIVDDGIPSSIAKTLFRESEAMSEYALSNGADVPGAVLQTVNSLSVYFPRVERPRWGDEANAPVLTPDEIVALATAHAHLARLVAPATPRTLRLLDQGAANRVLPFLGRIRLVRYFEYLAALLLLVFIATAFHADFSVPDVAFQATGSTRSWNAVYLVASAGLGAAFFGLYKANTFIGRGTYDQKYEASYWARFTLGIVAGVVLAMVIPIGEATGGSGGGQSTAALFTKPLLALIGGFSADVVYRVLTRLVDTLETLVQGSSSDIVAAQADVIAAREATRVTQARTELSTELIRLDAAISAGGSTADTQAKIREVLDRLLPAVGAAPPPVQPPPVQTPSGGAKETPAGGAKETPPEDHGETPPTDPPS